MKRDIDIGAEVRGADGHQAGTVSGVVLGPAGDAVAAIVIRRGGLVPKEKVLSADLVAAVRDHVVQLVIAAARVEDLPDLEDRDFVPLRVDGEAPGERIWTHHPYVALPRLVIGGQRREQPLLEEEWRNIPAEDQVLREGLAVRDWDGTVLGRVDEVVTEVETEQATHIVTRLKDSRRVVAVPVGWIARSDEDTGITLYVMARDVEGLPDYHRKR